MLNALGFACSQGYVVQMQAAKLGVATGKHLAGGLRLAAAAVSADRMQGEGSVPKAQKPQRQCAHCRQQQTKQSMVGTVFQQAGERSSQSTYTWYCMNTLAGFRSSLSIANCHHWYPAAYPAASMQSCAGRSTLVQLACCCGSWQR